MNQKLWKRHSLSPQLTPARATHFLKIQGEIHFLTFLNTDQEAPKKFKMKYKHSHFKSAFKINFQLWEVVKLKMRKYVWHSDEQNGHKQISEYIWMLHYVPNKYPNIFGCNIFTKRISKYIRTPEIAQVQIEIIFEGPFFKY